MPYIALGTGLVVFVVFQIRALKASPNVRRFWNALLRLLLLVVCVGLPWMVAWGYPQAYRLPLVEPYPNLAWVLSWLIPCLLMVCLFVLVRRLKFLPFLNIDPKESSSPVLAVTLVPLAAALASAGLVMAVFWLYGWLFARFPVLFLPVVSP